MKHQNIYLIGQVDNYLPECNFIKIVRVPSFHLIAHAFHWKFSELKKKQSEIFKLNLFSEFKRIVDNVDVDARFYVELCSLPLDFYIEFGKTICKLNDAHRNPL